MSSPLSSNSCFMLEMVSARLLSYAFTIVQTTFSRSALCSGVSFLPDDALSHFCSSQPIKETAFSTDCTSVSLATEFGSMVFKNATIVATSHIGVCGFFSNASACLAFLMDSSFFIIPSTTVFLVLANSISSHVLYFRAFLASCSEIQSCCAFLTILFAIVALSFSVPHNHCINH